MWIFRNIASSTALLACALSLWSTASLAQTNSQTFSEAYGRCIDAFTELSQAVIAAELPARFENCSDSVAAESQSAHIAALSEELDAARGGGAKTLAALERAGVEIIELNRKVSELAAALDAAESQESELRAALDQAESARRAAGLNAADLGVQNIALETQAAQWRGAYISRLGAAIAAAPDLGVCQLRLSTDGLTIMAEGAAQAPELIATRLEELIAADQLNVGSRSRMVSCAPPQADAETEPPTRGPGPDMTLAASLDAAGRAILYGNAAARLKLNQAGALNEQDCFDHAVDVCVALGAPNVPGFWIAATRGQNAYTALCTCDGQVDIEGRSQAQGALVTRAPLAP